MSTQSGSDNTRQRWLLRYRRMLPLGIFLLVAAITIVSVIAIERSEAKQGDAQLASRTAAIASSLERRADAVSNYLRAGSALLASVDEVRPEHFSRFVSDLRLDADFGGVEGIGWAEVVQPEETAQFNARLGGASRVPVTFLQPDTEKNRLALGYDMYSEAVRRAAMQEAERNVAPTASGKVVLSPEGYDNAPGFLIYMPVFEPAEGGRQLRGFIYGLFNADEFLSSALESEDAEQYAVRLFHGEAEVDDLLASSAGPHANAREAASQQVKFANSPFLLQVSQSDGGGLSGLSIATLVFGILVASMLAFLVRVLARQAAEDEASLAWFEEQASIRNSLTREVNHRAKNTLANVLSIIALTRRRAGNIGDFADRLEGRIRALSATHDLLTKSDWGTTRVKAVIDAELKPFSQDGTNVIRLNGPDVELAPNDALSLGLAMHELATNAAQHGALSDAGGQVGVEWEMEEPELVRVSWAESGGPKVLQERARGFGTDLIERVLASELRNPVNLEFAPDGVHCSLLIPVRKPSEFAMRASKAAAQEQLNTPDSKD